MLACPCCKTRRLYITDRRYVTMTVVCKPDLPDYEVEYEEVTETEFLEFECSYCSHTFSYSNGVEAWRLAQAPAPNPYY